MIHLFKTKSHNLEELFDKTNTLGQFCKKLEKQAKIDPLRYPQDKYLGDGFEFFIELFLTIYPCDNRIGVYKYTPNLGQDNGVDGTGLNINLEPCVIQIKYRGNKNSTLTATEDKLAHLISSGQIHFNVVTDPVNKSNYRHFVFTSADSLHHYTKDEFFLNKVKCFGYKDLCRLVDNNFPFWDQARLIVSSLKKPSIP